MYAHRMYERALFCQGHEDIFDYILSSTPTRWSDSNTWPTFWTTYYHIEWALALQKVPQFYRCNYCSPRWGLKYRSSVYNWKLKKTFCFGFPKTELWYLVASQIARVRNLRVEWNKKKTDIFWCSFSSTLLYNYQKRSAQKWTEMWALMFLQLQLIQLCIFLMRWICGWILEAKPDRLFI